MVVGDELNVLFYAQQFIGKSFWVHRDVRVGVGPIIVGIQRGQAGLFVGFSK